MLVGRVLKLSWYKLPLAKTVLMINGFGRGIQPPLSGLRLSVLWGELREGNGNSLQCSCLENPRDVEPGGLPSMGSHRVGHNWSDLVAAAAAAGWTGNGDREEDPTYDSHISFARNWLDVGNINKDKKHWIDHPDYSFPLLFYSLYFLYPAFNLYLYSK